MSGEGVLRNDIYGAADARASHFPAGVACFTGSLVPGECITPGTLFLPPQADGSGPSYRDDQPNPNVND